MKKIIIIVMLLLLGSFAYVLVYQHSNSAEKKLSNFIESGLMSPLGGIYTNYVVTERQEEWATGHEILSESMGLYMLAAYYSGDQSRFESCDTYLEQYMKLETGGYSWRILEETGQHSTNATIDDLRIARAYYLASQKWHENLYRERARYISDVLLRHAVKQDILLNYNGGDESVDLSYLDIGTMSILSEIDSRWQAVKLASSELIMQGYLGDDFPFYHKVYDINLDTYSLKPSINMIDALIVVLHLSEVKRVKQSSIDWLHAQLAEGVVYGNYRYGDWTPVNYEESTAVYALIMRIASNIEDQDLYDLAAQRAAILQVSDPTSPIYGAFAYEEALEVFSFDQLQMLVAYRRGGF